MRRGPCPSPSPGPGRSPEAAVRGPVTIWGEDCRGVDAGDEAADWFSALLETPVRLVEMTDDCLRPPDPDVARPGDLVSFADCFPVLLIGRASLEELNGRLGAPTSMRRFRPNLVVEGARAFAEDHWWRLRIGEVEFEGAENCERCTFPTIDPETGVKDPARADADPRDLPPAPRGRGVPRTEPHPAHPRHRPGGGPRRSPRLIRRPGAAAEPRPATGRRRPRPREGSPRSGRRRRRNRAIPPPPRSPAVSPSGRAGSDRRTSPRSRACGR